MIKEDNNLFYYLLGSENKMTEIENNKNKTFTKRQLEKIIKNGSKKQIENWMSSVDCTDFDEHLIKCVNLDTQETYIQLLCLLSIKFGEMTGQQCCIIDTLVETIGSDMDIGEYIDDSEDLDSADVDDFLSEIANDDVRYNFVVDMLLIAKFAASADNLEELVNYCSGITDKITFPEEDIEALTLLIRSIYSESSSILDRVKEMDELNLEWFNGYICDYDCVD